MADDVEKAILFAFDQSGAVAPELRERAVGYLRDVQVSTTNRVGSFHSLFPCFVGGTRRHKNPRAVRGRAPVAGNTLVKQGLF
jgi:hypothetical protein